MDIAYTNNEIVNINGKDYDISDFLITNDIDTYYEIKGIFTLPQRKFLIMLNVNNIYLYIVMDINGNMILIPHPTLSKEELITIFNYDEDEISDINEIYSYEILVAHPANNGDFIMNVLDVHPNSHPDDRYFETGIFQLSDNEWDYIFGIDINKYFKDEVNIDDVNFIFPNKLNYDETDIICYLKSYNKYEIAVNNFRFVTKYKPQAWINDEYIVLIGENVIFKWINKDLISHKWTGNKWDKQDIIENKLDEDKYLIINDKTNYISTYIDAETILTYTTNDIVKIININNDDIIEYKTNIPDVKLSFGSPFGWLVASDNKIEYYDVINNKNIILDISTNIKSNTIAVSFENLRNLVISKELQQYLYKPIAEIINSYDI